MAKKIVKYNPAFLSDKDLIDLFVVRHADLELVLQTIRENTTGSNQHMMLIGPRGIGKTTLALRGAAEIRIDKELCDKWYPLVFAEESYKVTTEGEFWLEALFHLGLQEKGSKWNETYKELLGESNEDRLSGRSLAQLLDFADSQNKRILLVVENFNMLLGDQISDDDAWKMREKLLHEPRIMLLATATTRFEQMDNPSKAMFELFRPLNLQPLNGEECREIWKSVTGKDLPEERIRALQILTGGNPRLMTIISSFGKDMSFKKLMNELTRLVDDHTEYFKSHLDSLPAIERKVYLALAELWDPALAKDVAQAARVNVSKASSLLNRLKDRGAVVVAEQKGRKKRYQVAERMYNIYHLMRRRGRASGRVKGVVRFMVHFYGKDDLLAATKIIAKEACELDSTHRTDHYLAWQEICSCLDNDGINEIVDTTPPAFFKMSDLPGPIKAIENTRNEIKLEEEALKKLTKVEKLSEKSEDLKGAIKLLNEVIELNSSSCKVLCQIGVLASDKLDLYVEAEEAFRKVVGLYPKCATAWGRLGQLLNDNLQRHEEAEPIFRKSIELDDVKKGRGWLSLGSTLERLERFSEAEEAYRKAVGIEPEMINGWMSLGHLLCCKLKKSEDAEKAICKIIELDANNATAWIYLGHIHYTSGKYTKAVKAYRRAVELEPSNWRGWETLGSILHYHLNKYQAAEKAYRKAIELFPDVLLSWDNLIILMLDELDKPLEALALAEKYLSANTNDDKALNGFAWMFFAYGNADNLDQAESWAYRAVEIDPGHGYYRHTLASILCERGKISESLKAAKVYLNDRKSVKETVDDAIDLFVSLAACGHGQDALDVLCNSASADVLEPLVVGLRLFIGEDVSAAAEILEVGRDVAKRIEEYQSDKGK